MWAVHSAPREVAVRNGLREVGCVMCLYSNCNQDGLVVEVRLLAWVVGGFSRI
jgi:hypothetical protein